MENILNVLLPCIMTAIGGCLTASVISFIKTKIGLATYNKMKTIALDIWKAIEEDGRLGKLVNSKIDVFNDTIKRQFPNITDTEINILRQAISHEFNKDKAVVEQATEQPIQEVPATIKYVAPDGTELVPATTTDTTATQ